MSRNIAGLDHLRALAITLVFLFHYRLFPHPAWVDTIGSFGWTGVDLFFVLSGYLIAGQIFRELKRDGFQLRVFYLKRAFRILPLFWVILALYYLVPAFREWESLPPLWKMLSFTQNLGLDLRYQRTFSHAWSLCIEEQFYLLLPLILLLLHRFMRGKKGIVVLLLFVAAGFVCRALSWQYLIAPAIDTEHFGATWYKWMYYPTYNRLDGLLAGISIAAIHHHSEKAKAFITKRSGWLALTGALLIGCAYVLCDDLLAYAPSIFGFTLIALAYGLVVAAATVSRSYVNLHSFRITSVLARLSYALYLSHKAAIHLAQEVGSLLGLEADGTLVFLLSLAFALLAAVILHYSVERPFLKWKDSLKYRLPVVVKADAVHYI